MPRRVTGAPPVRHYAPLPVFRPALGSPFTGIPRRIPIVSGSLGEEALLLLLFVFGLIEWMYYSTLFSVCQGLFGDFSEKNATPDTVVRVLGAGVASRCTECSYLL
jgi:hypothetical protein